MLQLKKTHVKKRHNTDANEVFYFHALENKQEGLGDYRLLTYARTGRDGNVSALLVALCQVVIPC